MKHPPTQQALIRQFENLAIGKLEFYTAVHVFTHRETFSAFVAKNHQLKPRKTHKHFHSSSYDNLSLCFFVPERLRGKNHQLKPRKTHKHSHSSSYDNLSLCFFVP